MNLFKIENIKKIEKGPIKGSILEGKFEFLYILSTTGSGHLMFKSLEEAETFLKDLTEVILAMKGNLK
jgi:hypothetical protein